MIPARQETLFFAYDCGIISPCNHTAHNVSGLVFTAKLSRYIAHTALHRCRKTYYLGVTLPQWYPALPPGFNPSAPGFTRVFPLTDAIIAQGVSHVNTFFADFWVFPIILCFAQFLHPVFVYSVHPALRLVCVCSGLIPCRFPVVLSMPFPV